MVWSLVYRDLLEKQLKDKPQSEYTVVVSNSRISAMVGHGKMNIDYFKQRGFIIKVKGRSNLSSYQIELEE